MTQHVDTLMQKEVTRKEFLGMSGLALVTLFGFGGIAKLLTGHSLFNNHVSHGYGSTPYGK